MSYVSSPFPERETAAHKVAFIRKLLELCLGPTFTQVSCSCTSKWLPAAKHHLLPVVVPRPDVRKQEEPVLQQVPTVTLMSWDAGGHECVLRWAFKVS